MSHHYLSTKAIGEKMSFQPNFDKKIPLLRQYIFFKFLITNQKIYHRQTIKALVELAENLEESYLQPLLKKRQKWVTLLIQAQDNYITLDKEDQSPLTKISAHPKLINLFVKLQVKRIRLDTRLESNQICEALMTLLQASPLPQKETSVKPPFFVHNNKDLAAKLLSHDGVHQFCTKMNIFPAEHTFQIEYSYCELYYTHILNNLLHIGKFKQGHRTLFSLAPKTGFFFGLFVFILTALAYDLSRTAPAGRYLTAMLSGLLTGTAISYLITTIASILYDQEHTNLVIKESTREISALSHFPGNNPHPIMKITNNGEVLYNNPASAKLLTELGMPSNHVHEILPENYKELAGKCIDKCAVAEDIEVKRHNRTLRYKITPFPDEQTVMFAGTDITRLKELELKLLDLNHSLEQKVLERTKELQKTQDVTILSLSALAETRDPETGAHINRTRRYVKLLAETLRKHPKYKDELDNDEIIDLLYRSAPLHDIGKVGIADAILLKPGPLTGVEFEEMKKHPVIGGDSLKWAEKQLGSNSFLRYAREIAYNHHEKWDGSGYPKGLAEENIPLSGRLMALADVYDALINKRVYKEAFSHEKSKEIITKGRGQHFDPDIVDAFLETENQFHDIATRFRNEQTVR
jgi:response regulator RpfG family c-di-GMP phosphodiesterase